MRLRLGRSRAIPKTQRFTTGRAKFHLSRGRDLNAFAAWQEPRNPEDTTLHNGEGEVPSEPQSLKIGRICRRCSAGSACRGWLNGSVAC